jgi:hypothetical protein
MIVFLTDHAAASKNELYEHGLRVPFIVRYPGFSLPAGTVYEGLIQNIDVVPSMFELIGYTPPPEYIMDGESFVGKLNGGPDTRTHLVAEISMDRAVIGKRWKYISKPQAEGICNAVSKEGCKTGTYPILPAINDWEQLYDLDLGLANGALEQVNLFDSDDAEAVAARERLKGYLACHPTRPVLPQCTLDQLGISDAPAVELPVCPFGEPSVKSTPGGGAICSIATAWWMGDVDSEHASFYGSDAGLVSNAK